MNFRKTLWVLSTPLLFIGMGAICASDSNKTPGSDSEGRLIFNYCTFNGGNIGTHPSSITISENSSNKRKRGQEQSDDEITGSPSPKRHCVSQQEKSHSVFIENGMSNQEQSQFYENTTTDPTLRINYTPQQVSEISAATERFFAKNLEHFNAAKQDRIIPPAEERLESQETLTISKELQEKLLRFFKYINVTPSSSNNSLTNSAISSEEKGCRLNDRGWAYFVGDGVAQNDRLAFKYFKKAAALDNEWGHANLGWCYFEGFGTLINENRARYHILQAVKKDNPFALYLIGHAYDFGYLLRKNRTKSIWFYNMAAKMGDSYADYCLGEIYEEGEGVERDLKKALWHYEEAAKYNHIGALYRMGEFYEFGVNEGNFILDANQDLAKEFYQRAAHEEIKQYS